MLGLSDVIVVYYMIRCECWACLSDEQVRCKCWAKTYMRVGLQPDSTHMMMIRGDPDRVMIQIQSSDDDPDRVMIQIQ